MGTDTWIKTYGRRTFVEGGFGVLRNPAIGGLSRGLFCIIGRIKVTLWLATLVAAVNMAAVAKWAARTGADGGDPAHTSGTDPPAVPTPN